jgi:acetyl-CoA C-acetyltransferase
VSVSSADRVVPSRQPEYSTVRKDRPTVTTEAFVYDAIRTPRGKGKVNGSLHTTKPVDLVVGLMHEMQKRNPGLDPERISDIVLGVVTPVGEQGQDIARTAALVAGLPDSVAGVQLNRFCASGLEAVNTSAQKIRSGWDELVIGGGVESMSRVPMGSDGGAMAADPATAYDTRFIPQGVAADLLATMEGSGAQGCSHRGSRAASWCCYPCRACP